MEKRTPHCFGCATTTGGSIDNAFKLIIIFMFLQIRYTPLNYPIKSARPHSQPHPPVQRCGDILVSKVFDDRMKDWSVPSALVSYPLFHIFKITHQTSKGPTPPNSDTNHLSPALLTGTRPTILITVST